MIKNLILTLLRLIPLCAVKDVIITFLTGLAEDTNTTVDDTAVMVADIALSLILHCDSPFLHLTSEETSAMLDKFKEGK